MKASLHTTIVLDHVRRTELHIRQKLKYLMYFISKYKLWRSRYGKQTEKVS